MNAVEKYVKEMAVTVPLYAIERAVLNLGKIEALALIRASFREEDDGYGTLENAKIIYHLILKDYHIPEEV